MKRPQLKDIPDEAILRQQQEWFSRARRHESVIPWTYDAFPQWPAKLVLRKMEELVKKGYLEYGVSLRTAWLTKKGIAYLEEN